MYGLTGSGPLADGDAVDATVGATVGDTVGDAVGADDGSLVGEGVGAADPLGPDGDEGQCILRLLHALGHFSSNNTPLLSDDRDVSNSDRSNLQYLSLLVLLIIQAQFLISSSPLICV